jgi:hypothetical protein
MPIRIDTDPDPINYVRVRELSEEFTQLWKRLQAFYLDALAGFNLIRDHMEKNQEQISAERLLGLLHRWRDEAVRAGKKITRIALAFEAGAMASGWRVG